MIFAAMRIFEINTPQEMFSAKLMESYLKNARIQDNKLIEVFQESELQSFKDYWKLIKPLLNMDKVSSTVHFLRRNYHPGGDIYEFEIDSIYGHRIVFSFYSELCEYDVYFYQDKHQLNKTDFIMGKTMNLHSDIQLKPLLEKFNH